MNLSERMSLVHAAEVHGRLRYGTALGIGLTQQTAVDQGVARARAYLLNEGVDIALFEEDLAGLKATLLRER
ncbi:hypothetical protein [Deinococcus ruber]|uniref:hypothetical protein n=1 Tax=Deinococcus ruber TaxID=1848197 RepID=UPI001664BF08|nr:hypothetical protein [Deinococcus ruber]